jgi:polyhydroxybutyrate depolymerase
LSKAPFKRWIDIAERDNIVLAIPQGVKAADGNRGWHDCRGDAKTNPQSDDVAFVDALLAKLLAELSTDASRVFASGISNGGHMSLRLAIERPKSFRAVGAVVANMPAKSGCAPPSLPISVLLMNGTDDPINPFNGGGVGSGKSYGTRGSVLSTDESIKFWLSHNKIANEAIRKTFVAKESSEADRIEKFAYCCGTNQSAVVLYRVEGGGHTEPSLTERYAGFFKRIVGAQSAAVEMADEVWAFFSSVRPRDI